MKDSILVAKPHEVYNQNILTSVLAQYPKEGLISSVVQIEAIGSTDFAYFNWC